MLQALHYLKTKLEVMHRGNITFLVNRIIVVLLCRCEALHILINRRGEIKLCDFGISGKLVNSLAKTNIGCPPYLDVSTLLYNN